MNENEYHIKGEELNLKGIKLGEREVHMEGSSPAPKVQMSNRKARRAYHNKEHLESFNKDRESSEKTIKIPMSESMLLPPALEFLSSPGFHWSKRLHSPNPEHVYENLSTSKNKLGMCNI